MRGAEAHRARGMGRQKTARAAHNKGGGNCHWKKRHMVVMVGSAAGDLLDKMNRETSCLSEWTSVKLRMEVWFPSQTATKLEITERREETSPEGGMGGGGGGTGKVLGP